MAFGNPQKNKSLGAAKRHGEAGGAEPKRTKRATAEPLRRWGDKIRITYDQGGRMSYNRGLHISLGWGVILIAIVVLAIVVEIIEKL